MSATISIDTNGILTVTYTGAGPDETHILQSPNGTKWTLTANGTTGIITVTDGATGTVETYTLLDSNNTTWLVSVDDNGILTVTAFDLTIVLAPAINAPISINGVPASGYELFAYQAGTNIGATTYKNGSFVSQQSTPILLNAYGLPTDPVFIVVGTYYDFVLLPPGGGTPVKTWENLSGGIPTNLTSPTEWVQPAITATFLTASSFTLVGDQRVTFKPGRRVKCAGSSTLYGTIYSATYDGTQTTVTVLLDSGNLDNTLATVSYGLVNPASPVLPGRRSAGNQTNLAGPLTVPTVQGVNLWPVAAIALHISPAPTGWLKCDGSSYLRASYPNLFAAIGTTFGAADGTHFNVPNIAAVGSNLYCIYAQV